MKTSYEVSTTQTITENLIKHGNDTRAYEAGWHWFIETQSKAEIIRELEDNNITTIREAKKYYKSWIKMVLEQESNCGDW